MCYGEVISAHQLHKARKVHTCSVCRKAIGPGEVYQRHVVVDSGDFDVIKECDRCAAKIKALSDNGATDSEGCIYDIKGCLQQLAEDIGWKQLKSELKGLRERFRSAKQS